jgi:hypothetical protein
VKAEETEEDEGEGGGGKVDMKVLAKNIDVGEMVKVVQVCDAPQLCQKS